MAQKRMLDLYKTFNASFREDKKLKLAGEMLKAIDSDTDLLKETLEYLQQQIAMRGGKRMNPAVLEAFVIYFPQMERFFRYTYGMDFIYDRTSGAFVAYKMMSGLSNHMRIALLKQIRAMDLSVSSYPERVTCSKNKKAMFKCTVHEFLDFFLHCPFSVQSFEINCCSHIQERVNITEKTRCLCEIPNSDIVTGCSLLNLFNAVKTVKARSKCLRNMWMPLTVNEVNLVDASSSLGLKVEDDLLSITKPLNDNMTFSFFEKNIRFEQDVKRLYLNVNTFCDKYPKSGIAKPFKLMFPLLLEVEFVYCIKAHRAQALLVELCKEAKNLSLRGVKVNFKIRLCREGQAVDPGIAKRHVLYAGRVFSPYLTKIDEEHNCGHAFDWSERNMKVHVCAGYNSKCELERKDGKPDEVPPMVNALLSPRYAILYYGAHYYPYYDLPLF